jgi:hypothetical protein
MTFMTVLIVKNDATNYLQAILTEPPRFIGGGKDKP